MLCTHRVYKNSWMFNENIPENKFETQYFTSLYFVTTTLSTCGYGDIIPSSGDRIEIFSTTILIFFGMLFYSYTIDRIQQMLLDSDVSSNDF